MQRPTCGGCRWRRLRRRRVRGLGALGTKAEHEEWYADGSYGGAWRDEVDAALGELDRALADGGVAVIFETQGTASRGAARRLPPVRAPARPRLHRVVRAHRLHVSDAGRRAGDAHLLLWQGRCVARRRAAARRAARRAVHRARVHRRVGAAEAAAGSRSHTRGGAAWCGLRNRLAHKISQNTNSCRQRSGTPRAANGTGRTRHSPALGRRPSRTPHRPPAPPRRRGRRPPAARRRRGLAQRTASRKWAARPRARRRRARRRRRRRRRRGWWRRRRGRLRTSAAGLEPARGASPRRRSRERDAAACSDHELGAGGTWSVPNSRAAERSTRLAAGDRQRSSGRRPVPRGQQERRWCASGRCARWPTWRAAVHFSSGSKIAANVAATTACIEYSRRRKKTSLV